MTNIDHAATAAVAAAIPCIPATATSITAAVNAVATVTTTATVTAATIVAAVTSRGNGRKQNKMRTIRVEVDCSTSAIWPTQYWGRFHQRVRNRWFDVKQSTSGHFTTIQARFQ